VQERAGTHSPSLDPEDPESRYATHANSDDSAKGGER
jgi:hypothetical protein